MKDTPVLAPSPNYSKAMPRVQERKTQVTPTPVALVPPSNTDVLEDENNHEPEGILDNCNMVTLFHDYALL